MTNRHQSSFGLLWGPLLAMLLLVGCGGQEQVDQYDTYFDELLTQINELTEKLESIDSAQTALHEAGKIGELSSKLSQKLGQSSSLPSAKSLAGLKVKERFEEVWEPQLKEAFEKLDAAAQGVIERTKQDNVPRRIGAQLQRLQKQIEGFRQGLRAGFGEELESKTGA